MSDPQAGLAVSHVAPEAVAGVPTHPQFSVVTALYEFRKLHESIGPTVFKPIFLTMNFF